MRFWFFRVLLNLAALAVGVAIGLSELLVFGSIRLVIFGFPVIVVSGIFVYALMSWGLAKSATSGSANISLLSYVVPLMVTYWLLGAFLVSFMLAMTNAAAVNPEAPDITAGFIAIPSFLNFVYIAGGGLAIGLLLLSPSAAAIADRPPQVDAEDTADRASATPDAVPDAFVTMAPEQVEELQPARARPDIAQPRPVVTEGETLEELFGLEPSRQS